MRVVHYVPLFWILLLCGPAMAADGCAACHPKETAAYRRTGMARSFGRATPAEEVQDFEHEPTGMHYAMLVRDGRYFQVRWQIGPDGERTNRKELSADYVMGSGDHARTWLSRTRRGTLIELPLGWYSEMGGHWGMNPGYDTARPPSRRAIGYECMFCHNAYPRIPAAIQADGAESV